MMRIFSWMLLMLLAFSVYAEDEKAVVVESAKELKGITAKKVIWKKDGAEMAYIPAGSFEMGDAMNEPDEWMEGSRPVHTVKLDAFYIDIHEVTVGRYKQFLAETGYRQPPWHDVNWFSPTDDHPMIFVDVNDAVAYCKWAGKRLPTEAEWEYAARGELVGKRYPWGDEKTDGSQCNFADKNASADWANAEVDDGYATCSAVGSYPANGYGLYDMAGNVYEWCADWWDPDYYSQSPAKNPAGPDTGTSRLLRGGAWRNGARALRVANRLYDFPNKRDVNRGFRCVVSGSDNP